MHTFWCACFFMQGLKLLRFFLVGIGLFAAFVFLVFIQDIRLHLTALHILAIILDLFVILTRQNGFLEIEDRLFVILPKLFGEGKTTVDPGFVDSANAKTFFQMTPQLVETFHVHEQGGDVEIRVWI